LERGGPNGRKKKGKKGRGRGRGRTLLPRRGSQNGGKKGEKRKKREGKIMIWGAIADLFGEDSEVRAGKKGGGKKKRKKRRGTKFFPITCGHLPILHGGVSRHLREGKGGEKGGG